MHIFGIGICPCCRRWKNNIKKRRRNTNYVKELDECNWLTACRDCQDQDDEYYAERWAEYYAEVYRNVR